MELLFKLTSCIIIIMSNLNQLEIDQDINPSEISSMSKIFPSFSTKYFTFVISVVQTIMFLVSL